MAASRPTQRYLTPPETAEYIRLTERALEDWRYRGVGPRFIRLSGRAIRYRLSDIEDWLADRERTSTSDRGKAA
jgi:predicted DNA-binding transcriptional regulator AlpA